MPSRSLQQEMLPCLTLKAGHAIYYTKLRKTACSARHYRCSIWRKAKQHGCNGLDPVSTPCHHFRCADRRLLWSWRRSRRLGCSRSLWSSTGSSRFKATVRIKFIDRIGSIFVVFDVAKTNHQIEANGVKGRGVPFVASKRFVVYKLADERPQRVTKSIDRIRILSDQIGNESRWQLARAIALFRDFRPQVTRSHRRLRGWLWRRRRLCARRRRLRGRLWGWGWFWSGRRRRGRRGSRWGCRSCGRSRSCRSWFGCRRNALSRLQVRPLGLHLDTRLRRHRPAICQASLKTSKLILLGIGKWLSSGSRSDLWKRWRLVRLCGRKTSRQFVDLFLKSSLVGCGCRWGKEGSLLQLQLLLLIRTQRFEVLWLCRSCRCRSGSGRRGWRGRGSRNALALLEALELFLPLDALLCPHRPAICQGSRDLLETALLSLCKRFASGDWSDRWQGWSSKLLGAARAAIKRVDLSLQPLFVLSVGARIGKRCLLQL